MAERNRINSQQVYEIGKYIWENRESLESLRFPDAHASVSSETGITITRNSFKILTDQMGLSFAAGNISPFRLALDRLEKDLGVQFKNEDQAE